MRAKNGPRRWAKRSRAADALVLLWSEAAAHSEFVELEWNIALAMRRPILPCLLDATPLPPALRALHAIAGGEAAPLAERLVAAVISAGTPEPAAPVQPVIDRLAGLDGGDPGVVLQAAKAVFAQQGWTVQGPVYQAAGDIHIHGDKAKKSLAERWQIWVGLVVGVLTAIALVKQLTTASNPVLPPAVPSPPAEAREQPLAGIISDERGEPLPGVKVSLPELGQSQVTDENGRYSLSVRAPSQEQATLIAGKDQFETHQAYAMLGNTNMSFTLRRKP